MEKQSGESRFSRMSGKFSEQQLEMTLKSKHK